MYKANNPKELKNLLKKGSSPILVTDQSTIKVVEVLESLKTRGVRFTARDKLLARVFGVCSDNVLSDSVVIALSIVSAVTLVTLYAVYVDKSITLKFNTDGSVVLVIK